ATSTACLNNSSVFDFSSHITGRTPQERLFWRRTFSLVVAEMIRQLGLYFEICLAVLPLLVTVIIAAAFRSWAVVTVACEMAEVMLPERCFCASFSKRSI